MALQIKPNLILGVRGTSLLETVIALPLALLLGLLVVQVGLLWHARLVLRSATFEAARAGAADYAQPESIRLGLARGLIPLVGGLTSAEALPAQWLRARAEWGLLEGTGRASIVQISPTHESFVDWGRPKKDHHGRLETGEAAGLVLPLRALRSSEGLMPNNGAEGVDELGQAIGRVSQQTLSEATLLKLRVQWGAPLNVPLIGPLIAKTMAVMMGCSVPRPVVLGALVLETPLRTYTSETQSDGWGLYCMNLLSRGLDGQWQPRWPVEASATVRMQTPAWKTPLTMPRQQAPLAEAPHPGQ